MTHERARTVEQMRLALAKVSAVQQVLEIAVAELETCQDERVAENVRVFATNFSVRQLADAHRALTGTP